MKQRQRLENILAPTVVLIVILVAWEGLVIQFNIQQFLLPRPSAIAANFVRVAYVSADATVEDPGANFNRNEFIVRLPEFIPQDVLTELQEQTIVRLSPGVYIIHGTNLNAIYQASLFTLNGAVGGLAIGVIMGIIVALISGRWTASQEALMPFAIAANSTPIIAFAPVMNNWFGIDNPLSKMAIVAIMTFFPMMINTLRGLTIVDKNSLELMHSYAATDREILFKLRIPGALPYVFNGLKISASLSLIGAIVGEYFGGPRIALGVYISQEAALFRFASAWGAIVAACFLGIGLYLLILVLERIAMPWHVSFRTPS